MKQYVLWWVFVGMVTMAQAQNVGIGTAVINPSAKLQVESTTSGLLAPRMTTAQRNAIPSPAEGLVIYNLTIHCLEYWNSIQWVSMCGPTSVCYQNCDQIKLANPLSADGVYTIDVDCNGPMAPMQCYCDMTTDGGGWTLVLNYLHQLNTNPNNQVRTIDLPLQGATALGPDESGTAFWGHASNSLMTAIPFTTLRFYAVSGNNPRIMHFKTILPSMIAYFRTGLGNGLGINGSFTTLPGHTAFLPATAGLSLSNQGDFAMCNAPFYEGCTRHWITGVSDCGGGLNTLPLSGRRWEADDMVISCCGGAFNLHPNTWHRVWVR